MKSIIIKNIQIQFDSFDHGADKHTALNMLDEINSILQERFPELTPQIFVGAVDDDDIEITDQDPKPTKAELVSWETLKRDCKYADDDNNDGLVYGLAYIECDEIMDYEWFRTEEERTNSIIENNIQILK